MWTRYLVKWEFLTSLYASVPADPEYIKRWLEARKPKVQPPQGRSLDEIAAEVAETTLNPEEQRVPQMLVFQRIKGVLSMRAATVRAHLKDCATVLSTLYSGKVQGEKSFAVKVKNALYWPPDQYWIPILTKAGEPVMEASGVTERAVHFPGPRGPVSALKIFERVDDAMMQFPLLVLTQPSGKGVISETDLKTLMMYGGTHGYGGERSYDGGRYVFTLAQEGV